MLKRNLFTLLLSVFLFVFLFAATVSAQNSCALKIDVTRNNDGNPLAGATAIAVNMKTKGTRSSVLKNGMPFFANLQKGTYRITVSKAGYRQSADNFKLDCSERNKSLSIELYSRKQSKSDSKSDKFPVFRMENKKPPQGEVISEPVKAPPPVVRIPKPTPNSVPKVISGGVVNGKATKLVQPIYPAAARAVKAKGAVNVQVTIDEQGNVISANAVSGHPLLRAAAVQAARASTFSPTMLSGQLVKVTGVIVYNFVP